jgi:hypothetical protein
MEYIQIENGKIKRHLVGNKPNLENLIEVENFYGLVGEPVSFYDEKWERKTEIQLMKENLIPITKGYKIENDKLIELSEIEKMIEGLEKIPEGFEIKENELVETEERKKENEIMKIKGRLSEIDNETIRPLRAKLAGTNTEEDEKKLIDLETEAEKLRNELSILTKVKALKAEQPDKGEMRVSKVNPA